MRDVRNLEHRGRRKHLLESFEGVLLELSPDLRFILLSKKVERSNNVGEVEEEFLVEVGKTDEGLLCFEGGRKIPGLDGIEFLWSHLNFSLTDNHSQKFHSWSIKDTLRGFKGEFVFL